MNILVLNCGSSSIKFQFINSDTQEVLAKGIVERIGEEISFFTFKSEKIKKQNIKISVENHTQGIKLISDSLLDSKFGVIKSKDDIDAVGHRLVHGGEEFSGSVKINEKVLDTMRECIKLAPLHNPHNIKGVEASQKIFSGVPQCGVFDTAFHQTMPKKAFLYALPLEYYTKHKIRRYGFHGTSHYYVAKEAARYVGKSLDELRIITCHLGNGASITAIDKGKSVDTSMGFTPLEGLVMGTRCGDLDPAIPLYMIETLGMNPQEVYDVLNKKSGMLGLSEISNDMRVIEEGIEKKNQKASDALEIYAYRLKKYIGAYFTVMNGVDIIVFTGGIGENMPILREMVCTNLNSLGIIIDTKRNRITKSGILDFSAEDSKVKLLKIPTNEELMIALETEAILRKEMGYKGIRK